MCPSQTHYFPQAPSRSMVTRTLSISPLRSRPAGRPWLSFFPVLPPREPWRMSLRTVSCAQAGHSATVLYSRCSGKSAKFGGENRAWTSLSSLAGDSPPASSASPRPVFPRLLFTDSQPHRLYRFSAAIGLSSFFISGSNWGRTAPMMYLSALFFRQTCPPLD